jgi:hypothetical protein
MKAGLALAACLVLQACALPRSLPAATDLKPGASEVVVIGKIELVPPLDPRLEQRTHWNVVGEKRILSRVLVATGADHKLLKGPTLDVADFQSSLEVEWGVPFMVKTPRQRTFVNGAVAHLDVLEQDRLWFPGGFYFDVPKDAAAVYIGTLRFHRNDFNAITRVEVIDERRDIATVLKGDASSASVLQSLLKRVR